MKLSTRKTVRMIPVKIKMDLWEFSPIDPQKINPANGLLRGVTGSRGGIRTPDMVVNSHPLCRLSYPGNRMRIPSNKPIHYKEYPLINSIDRREFIYTQIY